MSTPDPVTGSARGAAPRRKTFSQVTRPPNRVYFLGGLLVALGVASIAFATPVGTPTSIAALLLGLLFVSAGGVTLASSIRFGFDGSAVSVALVPVFRTRIPLDEVAAVDVVEYLRVSDARGRGARRRADGGRTLLFDAGPAIRLTRTDGRRFVVRSRYPGEAVRALTEALR